MNIVVTGGAGFIGSHLCETLLNENHKVINIDNFNDFYNLEIKIRNVFESTGSKRDFEKFKKEIFSKNLPKNEIINSIEKFLENKNYKLYFTDIRDEKEIDDIFRNERPDIVINLAGLAGVRPSLLNPLEYESVNVHGFINLLENARKNGIKKFIQASSSSVYGNNKTVPFKESDIVDFAISPYAATKKSCEVMGHVFHSLYKIDMIHLRFFTVYGERQRPDLAIYKFVKNIKEGKVITMYGNGETYRDYTYIKDIIQGIKKSIDYIIKNNGVYEILNLGEGNTISLKNMINILEKNLGIKANIEILPKQKGDVDRTFADITKAKNLIGYSPKTDFEEGIKKFINWYNEKEQNNHEN